MRRIGRYILNGLTLLSLLLCVATVGLWVRSYRTDDRFMVRTAHGGGTCYMLLLSNAGTVELERELSPAANPPWWGYYTTGDSMPSALQEGEIVFDPGTRRHWQFGQFFFHATNGGEAEIRPNYGRHYRAGWTVAAPHWFIAAVLTVLPCWRAIRLRRRPRTCTSACAVCNYDLRATPDRCPECGTIPTKVKA